MLLSCRGLNDLKAWMKHVNKDVKRGVADYTTDVYFILKPYFSYKILV